MIGSTREYAGDGLAGSADRLRDEIEAPAGLPSSKASDVGADRPVAASAYAIDAMEDWAIPRLVEGEIVPRLVMAHRKAVEQALTQAVARIAAAAGTGPRPGPVDVERLVRIVVAEDEAAAIAFVDAVCARGIALDRIFLDLLAPAAARLGEGWCADTHAFTDVTIGLARLQQVMRAFSHEFQTQGGQPEHGLRALLAPADGEQHCFGILMTAEFLIRAGWDVTCAASASAGHLVRAVRRERFSIVGLSLSCERLLDSVTETIAAIRRHARNPAIAVLVGGRVFIDNPDLVAQVGADAMAVDGADAVRQAERLRGRVGAPREQESMVC